MKTLITILLSLTLSLIHSSAFAHSVLHDSVPANGSTLSSSPTSAILEFANKVRLIKLTLIDAENKKTAIDYSPEKILKKDYQLALPQIENGSYQLLWIAIAKDTHKLKGTIRFSIDTTKEPVEQAPTPKKHHHH